MRYGSVCSGIEAATVAWHPLGWRAAWLSEIEPFPSAVLAHHYPNVPNLGDMKTLPARIISGEVEAPDVFCGGTPCQAFSVAGLRKSLDDVRGNLSLTFCEIANAIDDVRLTKGFAPTIVFWENVPGVLNTKDNAFGCFLAGIAGEDDPLIPPGGKWENAGCVFGPKRAVAWRVLDAQYFGVAQRRRRVFVVASARKDFDPAAVLFEFNGVRRDIAPSREAREGIAGGIEIGPGGGRFTDLNPTLDTRAQAGPIRNQLAGAVLHAPEIDRCIATREGGSQGDGINEDVCFTQNTTDRHAVVHPIAFHPTQDPISSDDGTTHAMGCGSSGGQASIAVAYHMAVRRLTPTECERLQSFPDDYTRIPWKMGYWPADKYSPEVSAAIAEQCPDGPRYKALGNSWAVPVVHWIGKRIALAVEIAAAKNDNTPKARRVAA